MKKINSNYGWLFACISLAVLLGISIYLGLSGWYYSTDLSQGNELELGISCDVSLPANSASSCSFAFSGGYLEGEKLPQVINVKNSGQDKKVYLRAKIYVFMAGSTLANMEMITNSNWFLGEDGYYYYNGTLIEQGKVGLCSHVVVGEGSRLQSNKKYIMTVLVEALDADLDVETVWGVNPLNIPQTFDNVGEEAI